MQETYQSLECPDAGEKHTKLDISQSFTHNKHISLRHSCPHAENQIEFLI